METNHRATIEAVNAAFSSNNIEAFLEHCHDDIEMGMIGERPNKGKDAIRKEMDGGDIWHPPVIHVTDILVDGDKAVCDGIMDMDKKSGEKHRYAYADFYTFRDGKISAIRIHMNELK